MCSVDGTWEPYPTCQGDLRETRDGCDGCPGPVGGARNRTAEAILSRNTASDRRVPKIITNNGERKSVPSFAGNINIGRLEPQPQSNRFNQRPRQQQQTTTSAPAFNNFQQNQFTRQQQQPQQAFQTKFQQSQRNQQRFQQPQQQQNQFQQPQRQFQPQFQQQPQQQPPQPTPAPRQRQPPPPQQPQQSGGSQSLFDQIKERINREKAAKAAILRNQGNQQSQTAPTTRRPTPQPQQQFRQPPTPQQSFRQQQPQQQTFGGQSFGVFEAVDLSAGSNRSPFPPQPQQPRNLGSRQAPQNEQFFGVFAEVNLQ